MKKLISPSERWPGYIGIPDTFYFPELIIVQDMFNELDACKKDSPHINAVIIRHLFRLVEEWKIEGIEPNPEKFPIKPLQEVYAFIDWWYGEVMALFFEEEQEAELPKNE